MIEFVLGLSFGFSLFAIFKGVYHLYPTKKDVKGNRKREVHIVRGNGWVRYFTNKGWRKE